MRLEVSYIDHPKFLALSDGAFRLWHEGKSYCEKHLTDGLILAAAARGFPHFSKPRLAELQVLITGYAAPLWETHPLGFAMHDYLHYSDRREYVRERIAQKEASRKEDRDRLTRWREAKRKRREITRSETPIETPYETPIETHHETPHETALKRSSTSSYTSTYKKEEEEAVKRVSPAPPSARSKRPIFTGQRVKVFEWQLDDLNNLLGPHTDAFDLHEFFFVLDAKCLQDGLIPPVRDGGVWLQAEVLAEAQRRGLPLRVVGGPPPDVEAEFAALARKGPSVRP